MRKSHGIRRWRAALLLLGSIPAPAVAQNAARPHKPQETQVSVSWPQARLAPALERLTRLNELALLLDRRVDPGQTLQGSYLQQPLGQVLQDVAQRRALGVSFFDGLVYLGPEDAAAKLRTLAALGREQLRELPAPRRILLRRKTILSWPRLTSPRELVRRVCLAYELEAPLERIPHDLWNAGEWPPLDCADQLTLLLIGFEMKFVWAGDGRRIELEPIGTEELLERSYRRGRRPLEEIQATASRLGATMRSDGSKVRLRGTWEQHQSFQRWLQGRPPKVSQAADNDDASEKRYTLAVTDQPVQPLLNHFTKALNLTFDWDAESFAAAGISLQKRTSFEVESVTLDELLAAALAPVGLRHEREGRRVRLQVAPETKSTE